MNVTASHGASGSTAARCDLSVIVPTYEYGAYIGAALRSVAGQIPEGRRVEIVVADDGSTDNTGEVVRALAEQFPVHYHRQENQGPSAARNLALRHASGRYLMFLDADDDLEPDCIAVTLDFLDRHPEVGLFFTNYTIYDKDGVVRESGVDTWKGFRQLAHRVVGPDEWIFEEPLTGALIGGGSFVHTSGLTLRREVYEEIGPFREGYSYGEDDEFYARAAWVTTAGYVDRVLSRKRNHEGSLIHSPANRLRNARHILELTDIQIAHYRGDAELQQVLHRRQRERVVGCVWHLIQAGERAQAWAMLRHYWRRMPTEWRIYKLMLRLMLARG